MRVNRHIDGMKLEKEKEEEEEGDVARRLGKLEGSGGGGMAGMALEGAGDGEEGGVDSLPEAGAVMGAPPANADFHASKNFPKTLNNKVYVNLKLNRKGGAR